MKFLLILILAVVIVLLAAFPMMWMINWLFAPSFLTFVFGMAKLGYWQTLVLECVAGALFKSTTSSSK